QGEAVLAAVTVINPDEEARTVAGLRALGCEVYPDYRTMLERQRGQIDLCLVPTGIDWHARMTIDALRAGANVLVEKPLCCSLAEAGAIAAAEAETGRFVAVGLQDFYEPGTAWLKEQRDRGVIGDLESIRFLGLWRRPRQYFERNGGAGRLEVDGQPVLDSPLSNALAHYAMLSLHLAGPDPEDAAIVTQVEAELLRA